MLYIVAKVGPGLGLGLRFSRLPGIVIERLQNLGLTPDMVVHCCVL